MSVHDLSDIVSSFLDLSLPDGSKVRLDLDEVVMQFKNRCPLAFVPCSMTLPVEGGEPRQLTGWEAGVLCWEKGLPIPADVPNIENIFLVAREVLHIPKDLGVKVVAKAINIFWEEMAELAGAKKGLAGSLASAERTPAS